MSYELHITRASHWADSKQQPILLDELKTYFSTQSDFRYSDEVTVTGPFTVTLKGDFFIWRTEDQEIPFMYSRGKLSCSYGEDEVIMKMKSIAAELHAIVQGDEGEMY
ncbi:hypothetical protein PM3016_5833 [Paenibacillus mucilaginosus 3016]|uniref:Uncharacterized protein n=2 Tax=Paenibacillus mucilaginosus TaxID=61624 RepID=H6NNC6_9BACL|nr:hypothetical protein [Paenibacillus mucilaginosus]AFC32505.1 hypothetical protein PM3016_5833 [Paenibacillus mucilaginosus 3016]AFH64824.1 hypothetical protein B2K_29680 [Paenibacillus mucilaginosus K02]WFA20985.1 hypothetical protein ERY13_28970 [Paenibacillus mucilaginosus]